MTRDRASAAVAATGYPAAARLVAALPDAAFPGDGPGDRMVVSAASRPAPPGWPGSGVALAWYRAGPPGGASPALQVAGEGPAFRAAAAGLSPAAPPVEWQAGVGPGRVDVDAPGLAEALASLFRAYRA